jgi:hypothetical protein
VKILPVTLFRWFVPAVRKPPLTLKVVRKPPVFLKLFRKPRMNEHWRNSTNESEGMPEQKFDAAYRTIFRISKCFKRSKQEFYLNFFLEQNKIKMLKPFAHVHKVLI